jgi:hypothetical protein
LPNSKIEEKVCESLALVSAIVFESSLDVVELLLEKTVMTD